jgi:hypothetical protein
MSPVPDSTRQYAQQHEDDLRYILRHSDDPYLRACAGAILIRGLSDPELDRVQEELARGREVLG